MFRAQPGFPVSFPFIQFWQVSPPKQMSEWENDENVAMIRVDPITDKIFGDGSTLTLW
jgi:hypothetical protein